MKTIHAVTFRNYEHHRPRRIYKLFKTRKEALNFLDKEANVTKKIWRKNNSHYLRIYTFRCDEKDFAKKMEESRKHQYDIYEKNTPDEVFESYITRGKDFGEVGQWAVEPCLCEKLKDGKLLPTEEGIPIHGGRIVKCYREQNWDSGIRGEDLYWQIKDYKKICELKRASKRISYAEKFEPYSDKWYIAPPKYV